MVFLSQSNFCEYRHLYQWKIHIFYFKQKYVQDVLKEEAFDICEKLLGEKAHFYVCGDVKMADDVCRTLQVILSNVLLTF